MAPSSVGAGPGGGEPVARRRCRAGPGRQPRELAGVRRQHGRRVPVGALGDAGGHATDSATTLRAPASSTTGTARRKDGHGRWPRRRSPGKPGPTGPGIDPACGRRIGRRRPRRGSATTACAAPRTRSRNRIMPTLPRRAAPVVSSAAPGYRPTSLQDGDHTTAVLVRRRGPARRPSRPRRALETRASRRPEARVRCRRLHAPAEGRPAQDQAGLEASERDGHVGAHGGAGHGAGVGVDAARHVDRHDQGARRPRRPRAPAASRPQAPVPPMPRMPSTTRSASRRGRRPGPPARQRARTAARRGPRRPRRDRSDRQ